MNEQTQEQTPEQTPEVTPQEPTPADQLGLWELLRHESVATPTDAPDDTADRVLARPRRSIWDL